MSVTLDTLLEHTSVFGFEGQHSFEPVWPASWMSPRAELDRFVEEYEKALRSFVPVCAVSSGVGQHYELEVKPKLRSIGALLGRSSPELHEAVRGVTDMLLGILGATTEGSEERESLLYELGAQFIRELKAEGVLATIGADRGAGIQSSPKLSVSVISSADNSYGLAA